MTLAVAARAADIPYSKTFSLGPGETAFALELPKFDPAAHPATPILESAKVTLQATFSGGMTFFNESFSPIIASGSIGDARVLATPIGTGLVTPAPVNLGLAGTTPVAAAVMSPDPDPLHSPPDAHRIDGEASIPSLSSNSSPPAEGTLSAYSGPGNVAYDVDFTALYPQRITVTPAGTAGILCNDRVTGQITVTYTAKAPPPTGIVLDSFGAIWAGPGMVVVNWRTGVESNLIGFHVEREVSADEWLRVSPAIILALGGSQPNSYRFEEANVPQTELVKYRLVQVAINGELIPLKETIVQVGVKAAIAMTASGLQLRVEGLADSQVHIEVASDVVRGPWTRHGSIVLDPSGSGGADLEVAAGEPTRFYRLLQE